MGLEIIYIINKAIVIKRLMINLQWRSKSNPWGRFGGGWNWKLGVQISRRTTIFNIFVLMVRIDWRKK